jgi:maltose O-acetyltransferase
MTYERRRSIEWPPWHLAVNVAAASQLVPGEARMRIYRRCGIDVRTPLIESGCHFFDARATVGPETMIQRGVFFDTRGGIEIGSRCGVGYQAMLCTSHHDVGPAEQRWGPFHAGRIVIEDGAWIGTRAVVLGGVTIGAGSVVAAGAVVTRDCEPNGLYAGVPARRVRDLP